jgi:hypothetical protein
MQPLREAQERLHELEEKELLYKQSPEQRDLERRRIEAQIKETLARSTSLAPGIFKGPLGEFERSALQTNMGTAATSIRANRTPEEYVEAVSELLKGAPEEQKRGASWLSDIAALETYAPEIKEAMGGQEVPLYLPEDLRQMDPLQLAAIFARLESKFEPAEEQRLIRELVQRLGGPFELRARIPPESDLLGRPPAPEWAPGAPVETPVTIPGMVAEQRGMGPEERAERLAAERAVLLRALEALDQVQRDEIDPRYYDLLYSIPLPEKKR